MAFTLSGKVIQYSATEREIFKHLPKNGKRITTTQLRDQVNKYKAATLNARASVLGSMNSLIQKAELNDEGFRINKSERRGPYPIEFWIVNRH